MFTTSTFIALFIKRTREPDANFSTDRERVGWRILCRASYTQSSDVSWEDVKPNRLAYIIQLFVVFHSLSVHLKSDWPQRKIVMCSIVYLAFDRDTNKWWLSGLDVTRKQQVHFLLSSTSVSFCFRFSGSKTKDCGINTFTEKRGKSDCSSPGQFNLPCT